MYVCSVICLCVFVFVVKTFLVRDARVERKKIFRAPFFGISAFRAICASVVVQAAKLN